MNITELENNMTKLNIFKTFANLKTTNERLEFVEIMNPKKAVIKDTNLGGKWRVPYSMMEAA